jgi:uncharacterized membrane protein YgcG
LVGGVACAQGEEVELDIGALPDAVMIKLKAFVESFQTTGAAPELPPPAAPAITPAPAAPAAGGDVAMEEVKTEEGAADAAREGGGGGGGGGAGGGGGSGSDSDSSSSSSSDNQGDNDSDNDNDNDSAQVRHSV